MFRINNLSNLKFFYLIIIRCNVSCFVQLMNMNQRWSFIEEDIQVKPSPELIPDEYEHFKESSSRIVVHTFTLEQFEENITQFCNTLKMFDFDVREENKHSLSDDDYNEVLNEIILDSKNEDVDGLLLLFCGMSDFDGELKMYDGQEVKSVNMEEIWSKFYSSNCKGLKNKPKIFIFAVSPQTIIQSDSRRITFEMTYDTPSEADILIIYNKVDENEDFIENFCRNIEEYGKHEDIISLVTYVVSQYDRPLVISTLTRKFYFAASDVRGYHSIIQDNRFEVQKHLTEVKNMLENSMSIKEKPTKEKNKSFFGSFRLVRKKEKKQEVKEDLEKSTDNIQQSTQSDPAKSKQTIITTTPRRSMRSRLSSQAESDNISNTNIRIPSEKDKRPVWRP